MTEYVLDNAAAETERRFASLQACYDEPTIRQLEAIGAAVGWSCLEVGGGGGSIARWLGDRVGPAGEVIVTDIDPRWMAGEHPAVRLRVHDIARDELDEDAFDLVHERLVLVHLPQRVQVLKRLIRALKPGGWLVIEDFDATWLPFSPVCGPADRTLFHTVLGALHSLMERAGVAMSYGRHFHALLTDAGLIDVHVEAHIPFGAGGSAVTDLHRANIEQLGTAIVENGRVTDDDMTRFLELIADPDFSCNGYPLISARGRRPAARGSLRRPAQAERP